MVTVKGYDAKTWGLHQKDRYDKVLLDVPCSSERHVLNSPRHFKEWSPSRTKRLAAQAAAMLLSALMTVKEGGVILYSTCALSPDENDGVIRKLLKKKGDFVKLIPVQGDWGEKTEFGLHILPDTAEGRGPLYICKIRKLPGPISGSPTS
jgi:16S rRNA C967 or C1407 C5-methylase (RsmB/RsmF family)